MVTPPRPDGGLDPVIALAAELCGIDAIWTIGGAQAIAALAFGAGEIPASPRSAGRAMPGSPRPRPMSPRFPAARRSTCRRARANCWSSPTPSADPRLVAADLLSQAEHDAAAQVILVTDSAGARRRRRSRGRAQLATLPRRAIAAASLAHARIILADDLDEAVEIANLYAPEHLSLAVADPDALVARGPQCRRGLRRALRGGDVRRLSRRLEPRPADRRRRPRLERDFGPHLPQGDERADASRREAARAIAAPGRRARPARRAGGACPRRRRAARVELPA